MRITEIAKMAQVSPSTVSRAINQPEIVAEASLERIREVMREHNYQPPPLNRRRGPKTRKPRTLDIGLWSIGRRTDDPNPGWFQRQMSLMPYSAPVNRVRLRRIFSPAPETCPTVLAKGELDGVIIHGQPPAATVLDQIGDLPRVWLSVAPPHRTPDDVVGLDHQENARLAVDYFLRRQHDSVAAFPGPLRDPTAVARLDAFLDRATRHGLDVVNLQRTVSSESTAQLVLRYLASKPRPRGLFLPSCHLATDTFEALGHAGLDLENEIDVLLGDYDATIAERLPPRPTAIDLNLPTLVLQVLSQLIWRVENPECPGAITIAVAPTLIRPPAPPLSRPVPSSPPTALQPESTLARS